MEVSFQEHRDCESSMGAEAGFTKGEESVSWKAYENATCTQAIL